jgi:crossover junction endodeoxyribonuclease RuvC
MFVLGIDPGLTRTGYGIVEKRPRGIHAVAVGVIRTDPQARMADRLLELYGDLCDLLDEHEIAAAAIEQVFTNHNRATATGVGRASGVSMLALAQRSIPVVEYTPSAVKMALTGFGGADKSQVQKVIQMRLGLAAPPRPADAADALAIAVCHVQAAGMNRRIERSAASS